MSSDDGRQNGSSFFAVFKSSAQLAERSSFFVLELDSAVRSGIQFVPVNNPKQNILAVRLANIQIPLQHSDGNLTILLQNI
jgi:hypothetical protein